MTTHRTCRNVLDDSFLNACYIEQSPGILTIIGDVTFEWVSPTPVRYFLAVVLLLLPMLMLFRGFGTTRMVKKGISGIFSSRFSRSPVERAYWRYMLMLLNLTHRMGFQAVALYAVFRQRRPCECMTGDSSVYLPVGSRYGMPSGDSLGGAMLGMFIIDGPFGRTQTYRRWKAWPTVIGVTLILLVMFERLVLGFHTPLQVTVGALLGVGLHIYSTNAPSFMLFFDVILEYLIGFSAVADDPALRVVPGQLNNFMSWLVGQVGVQLFVMALFARLFIIHGRFNWHDMTHSYRYYCKFGLEVEPASEQQHEPNQDPEANIGMDADAGGGGVDADRDPAGPDRESPRGMLSRSLMVERSQRSEISDTAFRGSAPVGGAIAMAMAEDEDEDESSMSMGASLGSGLRGQTRPPLPSDASVSASTRSQSAPKPVQSRTQIPVPQTPDQLQVHHQGTRCSRLSVASEASSILFWSQADVSGGSRRYGTLSGEGNGHGQRRLSEADGDADADTDGDDGDSDGGADSGREREVKANIWAFGLVVFASLLSHAFAVYGIG